MGMAEYIPDNLSKAEALALAAKARRRIAIRVIVDTSNEVTADRLAREVAAREHGTSPEAIDEEPHEGIHLALLHQDLPKLAAEEVVRFDFTEETVAPGEHIDDLAPLL